MKKGKYVIVRCRDAGVHAGYLVSIKDRTVVLKDSRRLWYWKATGSSHTLSGVAKHGISSESKIPPTVATIHLLDACEVISTTKACRKSIEEMPHHEVT